MSARHILRLSSPSAALVLAGVVWRDRARVGPVAGRRREEGRGAPEGASGRPPRSTPTRICSPCRPDRAPPPAPQRRPTDRHAATAAATPSGTPAKDDRQGAGQGPGLLGRPPEGAAGRSSSAIRATPTAMQTRINALTTDFVNRDDPAQRADDRARSSEGAGRARPSHEERSSPTRRRSPTSRKKRAARAFRPAGCGDASTHAQVIPSEVEG